MTHRRQETRSGSPQNPAVDLAGWLRSDVFDRLLRDVLEPTGTHVENRNDKTFSAQESRPASAPPVSVRRRRLAGVYIISVAARLADMHPQTLRKYERAGLIRPSRTGGALRLYSESDVRRLRVIRRLVGELGLNLAGVSVVLEIVRRLQDVVDVLEARQDTIGARTTNAAVQELRSILNFLGTGDGRATGLK